MLHCILISDNVALPSDVVIIKFEQNCKNAKINTRQMSYMPNPLNVVILSNSHLEVHSVQACIIICV